MKPKILIVDDSKTARLVVVEALKRFDCRLIEASDGQEGLSMIGRERPDLVLLDLAMPGMDGAQLLGRMHADAELRQIPVMMLTCHANRQTVVKIARLGVRDYLVKPFAEETLVERVSRMVPLQPKAEADKPRKRFDEPLVILLVDDKPAIQEQVRQGLSDTTWGVQVQTQPAEALAFCEQTVPDLVLVSLSLPAEGAFTFLDSLRQRNETRKVPVFGLSVKTASEEQARARDRGIKVIVSKPIQFDKLKTQIIKTLSLDISGRYFEVQDGVLILHLPMVLSGEAAEEVLEMLPTQAAAAVEAGVSKMVLDLSQIKQAGLGLLALTKNVISLCEELTLAHRIVGSDAVCAEWRKEAKTWNFASSVEEAVAALNSPEALPT